VGGVLVGMSGLPLRCERAQEVLDDLRPRQTDRGLPSTPLGFADAWGWNGSPGVMCI
jgi:hypothetical protein